MEFGRLGFCVAAGLAALLVFTLIACDPEQMGGPHTSAGARWGIQF